MKTNQERALDAGRRVQGFLDAQAAAIGTAVSASLRAKLDLELENACGRRLVLDDVTPRGDDRSRCSTESPVP